ncbi:hypothetical protein R8Z57_16810 [Microbacterium sp. M3]|uniref:Uncharacterized protein n=1 Tax=Microbacterium arthrosphaerae TaxID=792652 RepID=A0ABU4H531_9MICO|nr:MULTISPECIES: hypothetical protein [Microbacterium]MDW4574441.1 hypothetical protein [Microbacterium arthrosphaerae]MDW7608296.1 hypothetical protein [Microbacterium sp. M3]
MDGSTPESDAVRELSEPHAGATYGPKPQSRTPAIPAPEAPADEPAADPTTGHAPPSLWRRLFATRRLRFAWALAALIVLAAAVAATVILANAPRPDATMHGTTAEPDALVRDLVAGEASWVRIELSTLHSYGTFRGLEIWSGTDAHGSPCLMSVNRANDTLSDLRCAPVPAQLFIDISSTGDDYDGLPRDGLIRFIHRGDTVDAFVHLMPEGD